MTQSKLQTEDPQISGINIQNVAAQTTWHPGFVRLTEEKYTLLAALPTAIKYEISWTTDVLCQLRSGV